MEGIKEDVLTVALMSKEHDGRVRAVGSHVTPTVYFNIPKDKAGKMNIFLAQQQELMEAKARIEKLKAAVIKLSAKEEVVTDDKGSCSVKSEQLVNFSNAEPARILSGEGKTADDDDVLLLTSLDALQVYPETLLLSISTI